MTPTMMVFHVSGVFREKRPDGTFLPNLRSFQRTFVVVPQGSGLAIVNEEWFITVATDKQVILLSSFLCCPSPSPLLLRLLLILASSSRFACFSSSSSSHPIPPWKSFSIQRLAASLPPIVSAKSAKTRKHRLMPFFFLAFAGSRLSGTFAVEASIAGSRNLCHDRDEIAGQHSRRFHERYKDEPEVRHGLLGAEQLESRHRLRRILATVAEQETASRGVHLIG